MWIAIVDMDQPGARHIVTIDSGDDFSAAVFDDVEDIEELKSNHTLGVFDWIAFNINNGETVFL